MLAKAQGRGIKDAWLFLKTNSAGNIPALFVVLYKMDA